MGAAHGVVARTRAALVIALVLVGLTACEAAGSTAAGIVVDVEGTTVTDIQAFTLRTEAGKDVRFELGSLDLTNGAFPASHLREHMALASPVAVAYRAEGKRLVAFRLTDAQE